MTKSGEAVASTSYNLYGATKTTTDETGNPFAYNGEARDVTGLDYLRARYYDSRAGTFLTEDSYQGELTNPLSQNRYAYVQNNPVNYTDPSGHSLVLTTMDGGRKPASSASAFIAGIKRFASMIVAPIKTTAQFVSVTVRAAVATVQHTMMKVQPNHYTDAQKAKIRSDYASAVGAKAAFHIREAGNLALNWTKALADTMRHVCDPKSTKGKDDGKTKRLTDSELQDLVNKANAGDMSAVHALARNFNISDGVGTSKRTKAQIAADNQQVWDTTVKATKILGGEVTGWYNINRVWTGKDPVTGDKANRWVAAGGLALDLATYAFPIAKFGKVGKVGKIGKVATAAKTIDTVDDVSDATRAYSASKGLKTADAIDDVGDSVKGLRGTKSLDELPQNVQDAYKGYDGVGWKGNYKGQTPKTAAGRKFDNEDLYLPELDSSGNRITYKEYDVNSYIPGSTGRDSQRLVRGSDGNVYYTWNHYDNFIKVE
ncbi:RHS repeat-associated core domain-containing protein [Streptococcus cuniculi]|uniref:Pre-toxin TG domain-containing protein n=1 Tax=Streptococcus cuniculi TaxID=1432788 RepID=A0A4Y9J9X0_9STRE|nr:RHS repeat-associated core domain-containing protein [Streptococcus cuniculi]MBF0779020.1 hypothetical protein [Streptococcus cuniculi]TFU96988.1 hypothetical protein E4T82_09900 [Streptococcus cuniculi]